MWLTLKAVSDDIYDVEVKIQNREQQVVFQKVYSVVGDPIAEKDRHKEHLGKRAYRMTNQLIQTILTDPEFRDAFMKTAAAMAPPASR